jgi:hypothetical protein
MPQTQPIYDLISKLGGAEKILLHKHGIRLRVEKVILDHRLTICYAAQVRRRFLRTDHTKESIVEYCVFALSPLYHVGLSPMIGVSSRIHENHFGPMDLNDPFMIRSALIIAGSEELLLPEFVIPAGSFATGAITQTRMQANE